MNAQDAIDELIKLLEAGPYPGDQYKWDFPEAKPEKKDDDKYPHKCPKCGGPAFIGFSHIDCKNNCTK